MFWLLTSDPAPREPEAAAALERLFHEPHWAWAEAGEVGWWVKPEWRDALLDETGRLRLEEWLASGRASVVKSGPHRVVYRVELPAPLGNVYIKHFLIPDFRAKWRQWLRRGKGRNEAKRATRLAVFGVRTIEPVALGERRRKRRLLYDNYLISPELPEMVPVDRFLTHDIHELAEPRRSAVRRRLFAELGDFTARLHDGGYIHNDFHPGNLLVRLEGDGEPRIALIDLDALRVREKLDREMAARNLAVLNHWFWLRSSRSDRLRFLRAYLARRRQPISEPRAFAREIETATRAWAERLWRRWGKRCVGDNKYFARYRGPHCWAIASREVEPEAVRGLLRDPDAPFERADAVPLKRSRTTNVVEVRLELEGGPANVIYKRFNRKKWLDPIYTLFRPSRAWRSWQNGQHLASRGIPTPANLAVITRSARGPRLLPHHFWPHDTYLVTLKAEPACTLWDHAHKTLKAMPAEEARRNVRELIGPLARLVRTMHERSLSHRDLKSANILLERGEGTEPARLSLIDLVGVQLEHPLSRHHQVQNLARLQLSLAHVPGRTRTDSLRFLRAYLPWSFLPRGEWKRLWREVEAACGRKADQNRRRQRKLT